MLRICSLFLFILFAIIGSACTSMAPKYSASIENIQTLKDASISPSKVGSFTTNDASEKFKTISIRASSMVSPYETSYSAYVAEAIKQELALVGKLASSSDIEITGILLKNNLDASGFSVGYGDIEARFIVKKQGAVQYDKTKIAHTEWESGFLGATAIPAAKQEYARLVQKLLATLYADKEFTQALK